MRSFIPTIIGAMLILLIAISQAEEDYSKPYPPTPPKHNLRALNNDDDITPRLECTANTTDEEDRIYMRNGLIDPSYRWKEFYVYPDPSFTAEENEKISHAMWYLSQVIPCIKFGIWQRYPDRGDYVYINRNKDGCKAKVGRIGGGQYMNLEPPGCTNVGTIMHEMLHALGFFHEHIRSDRDDFITIHWENIQDGQKHNFEKQPANKVTHYGVPYNYDSIMHYNSKAFSKNDRPTITDKNGKIYRANVAYILQETDKQKLKKMYNC